MPAPATTAIVSTTAAAPVGGKLREFSKIVEIINVLALVRKH